MCLNSGCGCNWTCLASPLTVLSLRGFEETAYDGLATTAASITTCISYNQSEQLDKATREP